MWFDQGKYVGSLPPGAFKAGESLTKEKIRQRIKEVGFQDPAWGPAKFDYSGPPIVSTWSGGFWQNK